MRLHSILTLILILVCCSFAQASLTVSLQPETSVRGSEILLGDIASVTGSDQEIERAQQISLGAAPLAGTTRSVRRNQIEWRLAENRFKDFVVTGPAIVTIARATRSLGGSELAKVAKDALREAWGDLGSQLEIVPVTPEPTISVPEGDIEISARPTGAQIGSMRAVLLTITVDGNAIRQLTLRYRLHLETDVAATTCSLSPRDAITPANWSVQCCDIAGLSGRPLKPSEIEGSRMKRAVSAGTVLTTDNTEPIPLVVRRGRVLVIVRVGAITLTCEGVALQDGAAGDTIQVRNPSTNQTFQARVTDTGTAEITY